MSELVKKYDKSRMIDLILSAPWEFERSLEEYGKIDLPRRVGEAVLPSLEETRNIVIVGMGGSAIVGDVTRGLLSDKIEVPIEVIRTLRTPSYVRDGTIMIVVSYSGNTMETIMSCTAGLRRGAYPVIISSNGLLQRLSQRIGAAFYRLPSGRPPRTALAPMLAAMLSIFKKTEFSKALPRLDGAARAAQRYVEKVKNELFAGEEAKIAKEISGGIPMIYSYEPYTPIGFRLKTQLNENAKHHAFLEELPEANHNEIMGWEVLTVKYLHPIYIRGREERREITTSIDYRIEMLRGKGVKYSIIKAEGGDRLEEYLYLMVKVDLVSYLTALEKRVDPTPVATISGLKKKLENELNLGERLQRLVNGN